MMIINVPVLHEYVDPEQRSSEEDSGHADVEARQRHLRCRQEAPWIPLHDLHLDRLQVTEHVAQRRTSGGTTTLTASE